jgi:hypothetical protein
MEHPFPDLQAARQISQETKIIQVYSHMRDGKKQRDKSNEQWRKMSERWSEHEIERIINGNEQADKATQLEEQGHIRIGTIRGAKERRRITTNGFAITKTALAKVRAENDERDKEKWLETRRKKEVKYEKTLSNKKADWEMYKRISKDPHLAKQTRFAYKLLANGLPTRKMMKLREPENTKYENNNCITCKDKKETHNHIFTKCPDGLQAKKQAEKDIRNLMKKHDRVFKGKLWFGDTYCKRWGITEKQGNRGIVPIEIRKRYGAKIAELISRRLRYMVHEIWIDRCNKMHGKNKKAYRYEDPDKSDVEGEG